LLNADSPGHYLSMETPASPESLLRAQRAAFIAEGEVTARVRRDRLERLIDALLTHQPQLVEAAASDFGQRPAAITRFMDVLPAVAGLRLARGQLGRWMRARGASMALPAGAPGARGETRSQPLGVVGVISPWNFPIALSLGPLAGILAAGNRAMLKPSELTPRTSALLQQMIASRFEARELTVVTGDATLSASFARLAFDHLLFTGSAAVGRQVMRAAAEHLVPVTLELGGKCPVIIGRSAKLARAVDRILLVKFANNGQMCVAPDYVWLPEESLDKFVSLARAWVARAYPGLPDNPDSTHIISQRHTARLHELLTDAHARGAQIIPLAGSATPAIGTSGTVMPALVLGATPEMRIMREEIFGPLLPLLGYRLLEEPLNAINAAPRPLALYYFGHDGAEERSVLAHTHSGGVTVNDVGMHFLAEELPFGGVGASGMGAYHGEQGFHRFSHARAVFHQSRLDVAGWAGLRPPYGRRLRWVLRWFLGK
jgi:coniferyl-aldehyde dehydrogenase